MTTTADVIEATETRIVKSPEMAIVMKDRKRFERWMHRVKDARVLIVKSTAVFINNEKVSRGGMVVHFEGNNLFLDRKDPDYGVITQRMMRTRRFKTGWMVNVDAMSQADQDKIDPSFLGINKKTMLKQKFGIRDERHLKQIALFIDDMKTGGETGDVKALKEENAKLRAMVESMTGSGPEQPSRGRGRPRGPAPAPGLDPDAPVANATVPAEPDNPNE